jgi:xanthine dehydrogenase small subunit
VTTEAFFIPHTIDEAVGLLREHGSSLVVMAGGTIVMQKINDGRLFPRLAMSLQRVACLSEVRTTNGDVDIGATTTLARLEAFHDLPLLSLAAAGIAGPAVRTMATVGGNLFATPPYGDVAVALLALDAVVEMKGLRSRREVPLADFLVERGRQDGQGDELVANIRMPRPTGTCVYMKCGRRKGNTPSVVTVAVQMMHRQKRCTDVRIGLGAVGPHPLRARAAEAELRGGELSPQVIARAAEAAMSEISPFTDALATDWYRRKMTGVYLRRALEQAVASK